MGVRCVVDVVFCQMVDLQYSAAHIFGLTVGYLFGSTVICSLGLTMVY